MKRIILGGLALVVVGGSIAAYALGVVNVDVGIVGGTCRMDQEVPLAQRTAVDDAAMTFAVAVLAAQAETAYAMMTGEAQAALSKEKLDAQLKAAIQFGGPYNNPKVVHTYLLESVGGGANAKVICGSIGGTDWVAVQAKPGLTQAHVVVSATTRNNEWALTVWLLPEEAAWRVEYFHLGASGIVGRSPDNILELARQQRDSGHAFNAMMLYAGLRGIIDRGPALQLGIVQAAAQDLQKFKAPPELQGKPPFVWKMNGGEYKVSLVSVLGIAGDLGLTFDLPEEIWNGSEDAAKRNHAFIDAFIATHPDYTPTFGFLVARAQKPDGSGGFATVYDAQKGYR